MTNRYTLLHDIASYERDFKKKEGEKEGEPRREKRKGREKENRSSQIKKGRGWKSARRCLVRGVRKHEEKHKMLF